MSVMIIASLGACSEKEEQPEDMMINYNIVVEPVTLDPQIANDEGSRLVILNIFEGLVRLDKDDNPTPGVAESWTVSDDRKVYTFHLRKNACWSDGTRVTADDFVFGIQRAVQPSTGSETASTLYNIKNAESVSKGKSDVSHLGISAENKTTVKIELEHPDSEFLNVLATPPAMPCSQKYFEKSGGQYGRDDDKILSNGAFIVKESGWSHDEYIYLRRNTYYAGEDTPVPAGVNITIGESPSDVIEAVSDGTIDCYAISGSLSDKAEEKGLEITSFADTVWGISFNTDDDTLKNAGVRRALLSALDRNFILETLPAGCIAANDIIPENIKLDGNYYRDFVGRDLSVPFSENARQLLSESLKSDETGETETTEMPKLNIVCTNDSATRSIVNNIIESWNGLMTNHVNKTPVSRSELNDRISTGDYNVIIAPLKVSGSSPVSTLELFTSDSDYNLARLNDKKYDSYIDKIKKAPDFSSIDTIMTAEKYLNDNGIFYPLYIENRCYINAANVTGIIFHPYGGEADFFHATKVTKNSDDS